MKSRKSRGWPRVRPRVRLLVWLPILAMIFFLGKTPVPVHAQNPPPPDCVRTFDFTADGSGTQTSTTFDNRFLGCQTWTVDYQATGTGTITGLTFQTAPGAVVVGTFVTYAGTVVTGINPNTSSTGAVTKFSNGAVVSPWTRVLFTEGSFVGRLTGTIYGYKTGYAGNAPSGGFCPGSTVNTEILFNSSGTCGGSLNLTWDGTTFLTTVASITTTLKIPNGAAPTTNVFGQIAGDNNAWAAGRGAVQWFDGTANTYLVGALASDTPTNGQVPVWNTGGTVTWETVAATPGGSNTQIQFNNAGAFGGSANLTWDGAIFATNGQIIVTKTGDSSEALAAVANGSADGQDPAAITAQVSTGGFAIDEIDAITILSPSGGGSVTTNYGLRINNQTLGATNYAIFTGLGLVTFGDRVTAPKYWTTTNCADSAGAAACGSAAAGSFVTDAAGTTTVVSTTAVTANSQIFVFFDASLTTRLGIMTCNTTVPALYGVTARTAGASFTLTTSAPIGDPVCWDYLIVN